MKTRQEIEELFSGKSRAELIDVIHALTSFERLLTAREIAEASHVSKRDVLADMKAGRFVDPVLGEGFFCWSANSLKVTASAANAWRKSFFVPVVAVVIPGHKKERAPVETVLEGESTGQKARELRGLIRDLSPAFIAGNGAGN